MWSCHALFTLHLTTTVFINHIGVPGPPSDITYNVSGVQDCSRSKTALLYIHWIRPNGNKI